MKLSERGKFCLYIIFIYKVMLPSLKKINDRQFGATETKVYNPPSELSQYDQKQPPSHQSNRNTGKSKVGGGFKISISQQDPLKPESIRVNEGGSNLSQNYNSRLAASIKKSSGDINQQIKMIERKIRQCQKKMQEDKRKKLQEERMEENRYDQDFQQIIRRELELQGFKREDPKGFDYLTNPGGPQEEEAPQTQEIQQENKPNFNIAENVEKLERFYENSLKKKFQRREIFPHKACRRKTPKLYITHKTNTVSKSGKPLTEQEHKYRIMTKQTTPQQIYPAIPNFAVVKDNLSKNILAYLGDYKPFIDKTKEKAFRDDKKQEQQIVVDNSNKSLTVST